MRKIFPDCCASTGTPSATSTALSARTVIFLIMSFYLSIHLSLDTPAFLLDHLTSPIQQRLRNRQANLLRCFQIDDEFKLRRLLHRQIAGLGTLQDSVYEICYASVTVRRIRPVRHEPA